MRCGLLFPTTSWVQTQCNCRLTCWLTRLCSSCHKALERSARRSMDNTGSQTGEPYWGRWHRYAQLPQVAQAEPRNPKCRIPEDPAHKRPSHSRNWRSEEHTSELQSLMRTSYAVFCLKKKKTQQNRNKPKA